ncbi:MAG: AzlD family protein [Devosia sp.]|uniref:AzlD family protein n=1 Tax=Devosia sp. TaxID=1871048 RepID=UPI0024C5DEA2|nr:AzlD family protein [Devosia sp.]UYO00933.1 MAG: AzlD family protein [Devosia sp.]
MMDPLSTVWLILAAAVATYVTRFGGYVLISRMRTLPPRLEAALNAVPAAVLTTLWAPAFFTGGWDVRLALVVAALVSLRFPGLTMLAAGWAAAMAARHLFGL